MHVSSAHTPARHSFQVGLSHSTRVARVASNYFSDGPLHRFLHHIIPRLIDGGRVSDYILHVYIRQQMFAVQRLYPSDLQVPSLP